MTNWWLHGYILIWLPFRFHPIFKLITHWLYKMKSEMDYIALSLILVLFLPQRVSTHKLLVFLLWECLCRKGPRNILWLIIKKNFATVNFHTVNRRKTCVLSIGFTTLCQINFFIIISSVSFLGFYRVIGICSQQVAHAAIKQNARCYLWLQIFKTEKKKSR